MGRVNEVRKYLVNKLSLQVKLDLLFQHLEVQIDTENQKKYVILNLLFQQLEVQIHAEIQKKYYQQKIIESSCQQENGQVNKVSSED